MLVAKCLTNSDAASGRIILPRVAVETNLPFVLGYRHYALSVRDAGGRRHEFVIKSWANGTEHRRVFVLEGAADFLRGQRVSVGDAVGICTDEHGALPCGGGGGGSGWWQWLVAAADLHPPASSPCV